jgi:hypothetical protein
LYPDLHQPIVWAPGAANIGQLADVFTPGRIDAGNCESASREPGRNHMKDGTICPQRSAAVHRAQSGTVAAAAEECDALVAIGVMPTGGWL